MTISFDKLPVTQRQNVETNSHKFMPSRAPLILHGIATFVLPVAGVTLLGRISGRLSNSAKVFGITAGSLLGVVSLVIHLLRFSKREDLALIKAVQSLIKNKLEVNVCSKVDYNGTVYTITNDSISTTADQKMCHIPLSILLK